MKERKSYIGKTKDGFGAIWTDKHPEDAVIEKEVTFYVPDEGKVFTKDGEFIDSVVIQDGVDIKDYVEVIDPRKDRENDQTEM